jgi:hypothetical protein
MDSFFYLTLSDISAAIIGFDIKKAGLQRYDVSAALCLNLSYLIPMSTL